MQFASPFPESRYTALTPPFLVEHQACADRRVLVIYATDLVGNYSPLHSVQVCVGGRGVFERKERLS